MVQLCGNIALYGDGRVRYAGELLKNVRLTWLTVVKNRYLVGVNGRELLVYALNSE